jgi:hypothetical protein
MKPAYRSGRRRFFRTAAGALGVRLGAARRVINGYPTTFWLNPPRSREVVCHPEIHRNPVVPGRSFMTAGTLASRDTPDLPDAWSRFRCECPASVTASENVSRGKSSQAAQMPRDG